MADTKTIPVNTGTVSDNVAWTTVGSRCGYGQHDYTAVPLDTNYFHPRALCSRCGDVIDLRFPSEIHRAK